MLTQAHESGEAAKVEGAREVRSSTLRLLADLWTRFPAGADYNPLWPRFFAVVEPIAQRLPIEVRNPLRGRNTSMARCKSSLGQITHVLSSMQCACCAVCWSWFKSLRQLHDSHCPFVIRRQQTAHHRCWKWLRHLRRPRTWCLCWQMGLR